VPEVSGSPKGPLSSSDAGQSTQAHLILTQDLCRVCALPSGHVDEALDHLGCRADVLSLDPYTLDQVLDTFIRVGAAAGVPARAAALVASLRARLFRVAGAVAGRRRPRVAVLEWVDPPFTAGHWVPDLVEAAGGDPVAARGGSRSIPIAYAEMAAADPEIVLVTPCGFHLAGAASQAKAVIPHLPGAQIWAVDGDGLVVRPGPRLIDGVEAIAAILHPDAVPAPPPGRIERIA
jgi:iron complex transport system substrate-binding protein